MHLIFWHTGFLVLIQVFILDFQFKKWHEEPVTVQTLEYTVSGVDVYLVQMFCIMIETLAQMFLVEGLEGTAGVTSQLTKGHFVLSSSELMTISCWFLLLGDGRLDWPCVSAGWGANSVLVTLWASIWWLLSRTSHLLTPLSLYNEGALKNALKCFEKVGGRRKQRVQLPSRT